MSRSMDRDPRRATKRRAAGWRTATCAAALLLGWLGAATSAQAQYALEDDMLPPRAIAWRLADRGFTEIARPRFDGENYVVEAVGPNGARLRLIVDPEDGSIVGRRRLDMPVALVRPARPPAGYGWTESDLDPRRPPPPGERRAERLLPPADIPNPENRGYYPGRAPLAVAPPAPRRAEPAANPLGLNPDAPQQPAPRKLARIAPPEAGVRPAETRPGDAKAAARTVPEAPAAIRPAPNPLDAKADAPKARAPKTGAPKAETPKEAAKPETPAADAAPKVAESKPKAAEPTWQDPPEGKRNVRVIGGATVVPGTTEEAPAAR